MNNIIKKTLALLLALIFIFALSACRSNDEVSEEPPTPEQTDNNALPPAGTSPSIPAPPPTTQPPTQPQTLVVGYRFFSQKFSPFFAKTTYDRDVAESMTQLPLINNDRGGNVILNGIEGETISYNGVDYYYDGPANISIVQNADGTVDYIIALRDDLVFSDGVPITIDDVIFNMYVYSDPSYDGSTTFFSLPITGMKNYRTGVTSAIYEKYKQLGTAIFEAGMYNTDYSKWTQAQQDALWSEYLDIGGAHFAQEIVDYCVTNYANSLSVVYNSEVALGMYGWGFGDFDDDGIFVTLSGVEYDLANGQAPAIEDYWAEILAEYGHDFSDDGINFESAGTPIEDFMIEAFISGEGPKDTEAGGEITSITGIKKTGPYSCTVTTDYFEATTIYQFAFGIAPLHFYGNTSLYDYNNDMFGFRKGDLSTVKSKTTTPMGAGPYKFLSYESGVVSFEANENYYKGEPKTKYIRFQEVVDSDKLAGIVAGNLDITDPDFSKTTVESIVSYNSNGELSGNIITTSTVNNLGYGYIGICAATVNVGGDPGSSASKDLRAAFATLFAVYRDTANNSYYGERASTIQYPISNTSWAAPRPNDEGYRIAYSVDVNNNNIYRDNMTEIERSAAALDAAIGFFKAAGYSWNESSGRFTAAPAGAQMAYEIIIPAEGTGNHPAYGILTAVKEALASIGITLEINDPADSNVLWNSINSGVAEMWTAAWQVTIDPDMYQVYHSSNIVGRGGTDSNSYAVDDPLLDELILEARKSDNQAYRKATYKQCLEIIMEWAVEIPNYQRQNAVIFSTERVKMDTVTPDITTFWGWINDLELLEVY